MRILSILLLLLLLSPPAFADDPDLVDTKQGLTYTKPAGWVIAPAKKGAVSALRAAGESKSQIELRYAKITGTHAVSYFSTFHSSLVRGKLARVGEGEAKTYGELKGKLTEYTMGVGDKQRSLVVFEFTTDVGAWLVIGMFDAGRRDEDLVALEKLLGGVATK